MNDSLNVTEAEIKLYIEVFQKTLLEQAIKYIPEELHSELRHLSVLPAEIKCYVSTQFGVAFEYIPASTTTITTVRGSARIEDLVLKAPKHLSKTIPMIGFGGLGIGIFNCTWQGGYPFRLTKKDVSVKISNVVFESIGWHRKIVYAEVYGNRESTQWTETLAVKRASEEVLAGLVEMQRAKSLSIPLDSYRDNLKEKTVLLLGNYKDTQGVDRLEVLKQELIILGYNPLLVKDVPDHVHQTLRQKVALLGNLSRFVIIDDTLASGHISELEICEQNELVTIILRKDGKPSSYMTASSDVSTNIRKAFAFDPPSITKILPQATQWAEETLINLKIELDRIYPWRNKLIE